MEKPDIEESRDTACSFPGEDQPVYCKKTKYAVNFSDQSRCNSLAEANHSKPGYVFIPGTQYESLELEKESAKHCYVQRDYEAVLSHYSGLTALRSNDAVNFNNKCASYMKLGQYKKASENAVKVINLNPSSIKGHSRLIKSGILLGDTTSVELSLSKLLLLDPKHETLQLARERLNELKNNFEEEKIAVNSRNYQKALQIVENCLRISPQSLPFKLKKAEYLSLVGNYVESTKLVDEIVQTDLWNIEAKYIRGLILYYDESIRRGRDHFKEVLRLAPEHAKTLDVYNKAKLILEGVNKYYKALKSENYAEAHDLYSAVLQIDLQNIRLRKHAFHAMGFSSFNMRNFQQAVNEFSETIEIDSKFTLALEYRGKAYMHLKNYEEAIANFSRVCNLKINFDCQILLRDAEKVLALTKKKSYEVSGVHKNASIEEIEKAYQDKAEIHHPDHHSSDTLEQMEMHAKKFDSITFAHRNLLNKLNGKKEVNVNEASP